LSNLSNVSCNAFNFASLSELIFLYFWLLSCKNSYFFNANDNCGNEFFNKCEIMKKYFILLLTDL